MGFWSAVFATGLLAVGATARAAEAPPRPPVVINPDWLKKPTAEDIIGVWPPGALQHGVQGRATIDCRVNLQGLAEDCRVDSETPAGQGFGVAAISLAPQFQFRPATRDGVPFASRVSVPINFHTDKPTNGAETSYTEFFLVRTAVWLQAPRFDDLGAAYPRGGGGQPGYVAFRCGVKPDGFLRNCEAIRENPTGKGFESAARGLLKIFRLDLDAEGLKSKHSIMVDVPIRLIDPRSNEFTSRVVGEPLWLTTVDPKTAGLFPAQAAQARFQTGRGVAECVVAPDGRLTACAPGAATPPGLGFSELAVQVAGVMRMNRWSNGGGPIDGAHINLPVRFNLKPDASPPATSSAKEEVKPPA